MSCSQHLSGFKDSSGSPWWHTGITAVLAAGLIVAAAFVMFSAFMFYDDEGYVLISLRNFAKHGGLYRDVYTQYGPFPYVLHTALHLLGMPLTHVAGRLVTLVAWAGAAVLSAAMVRQATRSLPATLAVLAATFCCLWVMANEPSHPGGLITFLTALMAAAGHRLLSRERVAAWAVLSGVTIAALALTKINVGLFAGLSALAWMLLHARNDALRRWTPVLLVLGGVLLPAALMRPLLDREWVQTYALVFACSASAVAVATTPASRPLVGSRALGWSVIAGLVVATLVTGVVLARGTNLAELVDGVVTRPMRQPTSFSLRFLWPTGSAMAAVVSLLAGVACAVLRQRGSTGVHTGVAMLRLASTAGAGVAMAWFPATSPDRLLFAFIVPWLWTFLWPLPGDERTAVTARMWPGLILLGQYLHPFPVAGSQIAWGVFLILPMAGIGGVEAARWLKRHSVRNDCIRRGGVLLRPEEDSDWRKGAASLRPYGEPVGAHGAAHGNPNGSSIRVRSAATLLKLGVLLLTLWLCLGFGYVAHRYRDGSDLRLPGAEPVRLPTETAALYRILALNAAIHSDMLFSEPGMFSLNIWSGIPTPTRSNVTHWFSLLNDVEQRRILAALESEPRSCVIVERSNLGFLRERGFAPTGTLHDYIADNFSPAFIVDGFEFCVRNGRDIAPLMLGEIHVTDEPTGPVEGEDTILEIRAVLPPGVQIQQVELGPTHDPAAPALVLSAANARVQAMHTDLEGRPVAPTRDLTWPLRLDGPATVRIHFDRHQSGHPKRGAVITFRDSEGREVALARLRE